MKPTLDELVDIALESELEYCPECGYINKK